MLCKLNRDGLPGTTGRRPVDVFLSGRGTTRCEAFLRHYIDTSNVRMYKCLPSYTGSWVANGALTRDRTI